MPFDPNSPFDPTDPTQWWRLQHLPHLLLQPNAPPSPASGGAEGDGLPNDWFVPEADGFPNDWFNPDNNTAPAPNAAPPPSRQPNPAAANRSLEHLDPYHAFWSQMPASRAGAMAWHPPIFLSPDPSTWLPPPTTLPNPFEQFPPTANAPPDLPPDVGPGGIFGGVIARMIAEQAKANDPLERLAKYSVFGNIPKTIAAQTAANDPWAASANGLPGGIAKLQQGNGHSPFETEPSNVRSNGVVPGDALQAGPGSTNLTMPPSASAAPRTLAGIDTDQSILDEGPTATNAAYIYPNPLDQLLPCFVSSIGCLGGIGGGGPGRAGGEGPVGPRTPPPSAPRAPVPEPRAPTPSVPGTPRPAPVGEQPESTEASPSGTAGGGGGSPYGGLGGSGGPNITKQYSRPPNATTRRMRASVQGQPCVDCGAVHPRMHANHIEPLVQQYYRAGTIDTAQMRSPDAVNAQCPTCSARQGGIMAGFSKFMRDLLGL